MNVTIRFSGGQRADFGNHDFAGVLASSFERFARRLKRVCLYIEDINGPRKGVDKQCRCVLHLRGLPPLVIQDQDASMHALIHRIANRAAYALSQKSERRWKRAQRVRSLGEQAAALAERDRNEVA